MLKKLNELKNRDEGFTIIEVLIVLAIAALIMVIVLVAIPQLQRNQRNTARKDAISRMATEINSFAGNNNGAIPKADVASADKNIGTTATAAGFFARYMGCTAATTCTGNANNPSTGNPYTTAAASTLAAPTAAQLTAGLPAATPTTTDIVGYYTKVVCDGENPTTTNAGDRNFALVIPLEGGSRYCIDNK